MVVLSTRLSARQCLEPWTWAQQGVGRVVFRDQCDPVILIAGQRLAIAPVLAQATGGVVGERDPVWPSQQHVVGIVGVGAGAIGCEIASAIIADRGRGAAGALVEVEGQSKLLR